MTDRLHPEMRALIERRAAAGLPPFAVSTVEQVRQTFALGQAMLPPGRGAKVASIQDFSIDGPAGPVPLRRYRPNGEVRGRILYMHGGGWVFGTLDAFDPVCRELADASGAEVVSVDYRLAPEAPFPGPLDDCWAALNAVAEPGVPLAVAGDSAGGNLAAALALKARHAGGPDIRLQLLAYPVLDSDFERPSYRDYGAGDYLLSAADMAWFWDHHVREEDRTSGYAAPLRAENLAELPEAIIVLAGCDPLHDEGAAYAERLHAAGVPVELRDHPDMAHGFFTLVDVISPTKPEVRAVGELIRQRLA